MNPITEGQLTFQFDLTVSAEKYDEWDFYEQTMKKSPQPKGVDIAVVQTSAAPLVTFLIEVKDFRVITNPPNPSNLTDLPQTMALKVEHTIDGLKRAAAEASVSSELDFALLSQRASSIQVVLHMEEHTGPSIALFPTNFRANVYQKLKQLVLHRDPSPLVLNLENTSRAGVPWSVR